MEYCHVKFKAKDDESLTRLTSFFELIKEEKDSSEEPDEKKLSDFLSEGEKGHFWNPSEEEQKEWQRFWAETAVEIRISLKMPLPPWDLESMYEAFWNGDYDLISITKENDYHHLNFNPHGYPYGGTGSMVALVNCFGHTIVGIDDGTGYAEYVDWKIKWVPGMKYPYVPPKEESKKQAPAKKPWWKFWLYQALKMRALCARVLRLLPCQCKRPLCDHKTFQSNVIGEDQNGAEVEILICNKCGQHWLKYLIEWPHYSNSGRWWRARVSEFEASSISANNVKSYIEQQPWCLVGGSFYDQGAHKISAPIKIA